MHGSLLLRSAVATLLRVLQCPFEDTADRLPFVDFVAEDGAGRSVGIYLEDDLPGPSAMQQLTGGLMANRPRLAAYYYVVLGAPPEDTQQAFASALGELGLDGRLISTRELTAALGQDYPLDLARPADVKDLRLAAFVDNLVKHGVSLDREVNGDGPERRLGTLIRYGRNQVPLDYRILTRQFPHATVGQLIARGGDLREKLGIGTNVRPVTVVLSDLKNFSKLVHAVHPATLNEIMGRYYLQARDLVFQHHGVLDKFIGDAVLAIFNYPASDRAGEVNAINFAQDLIALGQRITAEILSAINDDIETGTRVGIASGGLWVIDIGYEETEVSFVGDVINLAARLEAASDVNGTLMDNITYNLAKKRDPGLLEKLGATPEILSVDKVKGQSNPVRVWRVPPR